MIYDCHCPVCEKDTVMYAKLDDRDNIACPQCGTVMSRLLPKRLHVVYHATGFAHQEIEKDKHNQLIQEVEDEGTFQTQTEVEEGVAQGIARAEKMGIDPRRIVGKDVYESGGVASLEDAMIE